MGFVAVSAKDAADGVESAVSKSPDLILLDLMMPKIDGLKATRMLRALPERRNTPILVVNALATRSDVQECMAAGCTDSIAKPFTFKELEKRFTGSIAP